MRRAAATTDRTTTAVEQGQFDAVALGDFHQRFLSAVLCPGSRQLAGVLGGVGVTDHHFLTITGLLAIDRHAQQRVDDRA